MKSIWLALMAALFLSSPLVLGDDADVDASGVTLILKKDTYCSEMEDILRKTSFTVICRDVRTPQSVYLARYHGRKPFYVAVSEVSGLREIQRAVPGRP